MDDHFLKWPIAKTAFGQGEVQIYIHPFTPIHISGELHAYDSDRMRGPFGSSTGRLLVHSLLTYGCRDRRSVVVTCFASQLPPRTIAAQLPSSSTMATGSAAMEVDASASNAATQPTATPCNWVGLDWVVWDRLWLVWIGSDLGGLVFIGLLFFGLVSDGLD